MSNDTPTDGTAGAVPVGVPEVLYRSHATVSRNRAIGSAVLFVACVASLVFGAEADERGKLAFGIAIAVVVFVAGAAGLAYGLIFRTRLSLYPNGVLVETLRSKAFTRWDDIEAIFEFDPPPARDWLGAEVKHFWCGFSRIDGRTVWFRDDRMSGLRDFAARLHGRLDERIRANALRALAAGEEVWFGHIGISRAGIHSRKGLLPWSEVSAAGCVRDTDFEVLKKGSNWGWFSRKVSDVENVAILEELIKSWREWMLLG